MVYGRVSSPLAKKRSGGKGHAGDRLSLLKTVITLFAVAVVLRLFVLQVLNHGFYVALAEDQHAISEKLLPTRGELYFRDQGSDDLLPLATNREVRFVYAVPKLVEDIDETAKDLAELLEMDVEEVRARLDKPGDGYEPIKHAVDVAVAERIASHQHPGIRLAPETIRTYPFGETMSQITGFVGYVNDLRTGQYGMEGYFEEELAGHAGHLRAESDGDGRQITVGVRTIEEATDGDSFVLTIDRTIQHTVCKKLEEAVTKHGASGGTVIIVNPKTGAIMSMCNAPTFNANDYGAATDLAVYSNKAVFDQYEAGSVIKTMTLAAAMDKGLITPDTEFEDPGSVQIGSFTIRNAEDKEYGTVTMTKVLTESINTGAMFASRLLGPQTFARYMELFGFGLPTGVEVQGESSGDTSSLTRDGEIWSATGSFGQGFSVTPLQLVMAYATIANDGDLMRPYLVAEVRKPNGFIQTTEPTVVRNVLQPATARTMQAMLVKVVQEGHGKRASVPGYYVGGKTGTAEIPYGNRPGYDPNRHIGTFVGFAPLRDPAFTMLVKIDEPKDVQFAESSAAPLFGEIADFLLQYLREVPDAEGAS